MKYIGKADITHGSHCGYISPIPYLEFDDTMSEEDFHVFVEAISNELVMSDGLKVIMENGGVTYADANMLNSEHASEVHVTNHACIGWIRYKPLLLYITGKDSYEEKIQEMRKNLQEVLPKVCAYFSDPNFNNILVELDEYDKNAENYYQAFKETQVVWAKIMEHFGKNS